MGWSLTVLHVAGTCLFLYSPPSLTFQYYRFYANTGCTDFAMAARQMDWTVIGDVDFYVSITDPFPSWSTPIDEAWSAHTNHDDSLALRNVCSPDGGDSIVFYIAVNCWAGSGLLAELVATTRNTFLSIPISSIPPHQITKSLARTSFSLLSSFFLLIVLGSGITITCGSGDDEEKWSIDYPAKPNCNTCVLLALSSSLFQLYFH